MHVVPPEFIKLLYHLAFDGVCLVMLHDTKI